MTACVTTFREVPDFAVGFVRDHRVRWAHEEIGRPYEVVQVDRESVASSDYLAWQPFGQVPAYRDGEVEMFESGAIVLHIARSSEVLAPKDEAGFARVASWVFAAVNSVEQYVGNFVNLDGFHAGEAWVEGYRPVAEAQLRRRLASLETWLEGRANLQEGPYLDGGFTAADIMMSTVLRELEESGILNDYPRVAAYLARCQERPAWKRALAAQRANFGV